MTDKLPDKIEVLNQARNALDDGYYTCHDHKLRKAYMETITAIDKLLEETK